MKIFHKKSLDCILLKKDKLRIFYYLIGLISHLEKFNFMSLKIKEYIFMLLMKKSFIWKKLNILDFKQLMLGMKFLY